MTTAVQAGRDTATAAVRDLVGRLGFAPPPEALPGADLVAAAQLGLEPPVPGRLLRAADGWFHPGPPTAWAEFTAMALSLGALCGSASDGPADGRPDGLPDGLPDVSMLTVDALDAEAAAWFLPATAVRTARAAAPAVPEIGDVSVVRGARVALLGTAWAAPLVGLLLVRLGADVVRVDDPRRDDPFPLAARLAANQERIRPDLTTPTGRDELLTRLGHVDLLVDGFTPRVLANAGLGDDVLAAELPQLARLRIAAFADTDRPGYGLAAECRGGWAARTDPPQLGRSSVADPVAGCLGALHAVALLGARSGAARVSLEGAGGHLLATEAAR